MKGQAAVPISLSAGSFLVIEGPIGVGKTSLARRLSLSLGLEGLFEEPQENPFLTRFYENRRAYALATQLFSCSSAVVCWKTSPRAIFCAPGLWRIFSGPRTGYLPASR